MIALKRVYEPPAESDGCRVLVDRLWPRGLARDKAKIDEWLKDIAPSSDLRKWFGHDPERWPEFRERYRTELDAPERAAPLGRLRELARKGRLTLLFAARDEARNNAMVLRDYLEESISSSD